MQDHNVVHRPAGDNADALMIPDTPRFVSSRCALALSTLRVGLLTQERVTRLVQPFQPPRFFFSYLCVTQPD